jgi:hypothetical protein
MAMQSQAGEHAGGTVEAAAAVGNAVTAMQDGECHSIFLSNMYFFISE